MSPTSKNPLHLRRLGRRDYQDTWQAMRAFTDARGADTPDEIWIVEHPPVYTQGVAGKPEHVLDAGDVPLLRSDRGGQVTYHGPGQLVLYTLLDLRRLNLSVKVLVQMLEQAVIAALAQYGIRAEPREGAPGVYVDGAKIASLGLRVRQGGCYHGLSLNVDMDLGPFGRINPCGYAGLAVTQLADLGVSARYDDPAAPIIQWLARALGYGTFVFAGD
ncbi:lipoyl(octanoyl) transferase LipB, partial [Methylogaea oryzae]